MKKRISIWFWLVGLFSIIIMAVVSTITYYQIYKEHTITELKIYAAALSTNHDFINNQEIDSSKVDNELRITMIDKAGEVIYESKANKQTMDNHNNRDEILSAITKGEGITQRESKTVGKKLIYYAKLLDHGIILRIGIEIDGMLSLFFQVIPYIIIIVIVILIMYGFLSYYVSKQVVKPINVLASDMENIDNKKIYDEIKPLTNKIASQNKMREEFTANVSHELKTPLTSIIGYAQLIESGIAKEEDIINFANKIDKESNRLLVLINDIMKLSRLDEEQIEDVMEDVDLLDITDKCIKRLELKIEKSKADINVVGDSITIKAVPSMIEELIYNLCDNSIRYCKNTPYIIVSIFKRGTNEVVFSVKDNGIGIDKESQKHIFERFYRVDKSHSKETGGTGLGLSIVKHIVLYHKAKIEIESVPENGTQISVVFNI